MKQLALTALVVLALALPAWAQTTICQDAFTDTNGTLLENHTATGPGCATATWTKLSTTGASISSNAVVGATSSDIRYQQNAAPGTADYSVAIDVILSTSGSAGYAIGRVSNSGQDWYECGDDNTGGLTKLVLRSYVGGVLTTTIGSTNFAGGTGTYTLTMNGTSISCAKSGGSTLSGTNSDVSAAGVGGLHFIASGIAQLDNYAAMTLTGGGGGTVRSLSSTGAGR